MGCMGCATATGMDAPGMAVAMWPPASAAARAWPWPLRSQIGISVSTAAMVAKQRREVRRCKTTGGALEWSSATCAVRPLRLNLGRG